MYDVVEFDDDLAASPLAVEVADVKNCTVPHQDDSARHVKPHIMCRDGEVSSELGLTPKKWTTRFNRE